MGHSSSGHIAWGLATPQESHGMVVNHADRLDKCIDNGGTNKLKAPSFHIFRDAVAGGVEGQHFTKAGEVADLRVAINKSQEIGI